MVTTTTDLIFRSDAYGFVAKKHPESCRKEEKQFRFDFKTPHLKQVKNSCSSIVEGLQSQDGKFNTMSSMPMRTSSAGNHAGRQFQSFPDWLRVQDLWTNSSAQGSKPNAIRDYFKYNKRIILLEMFSLFGVELASKSFLSLMFRYTEREGLYLDWVVHSIPLFNQHTASHRLNRE